MSLEIKPKIFIAVPAYGQSMCAQTVSTIMNLDRLLTSTEMFGGFGTLSFPDIVEVRDIFLSIWYDKILTSHLLFIDSDMAFDPQLIVDMIKMDKPLVGALCPKRRLPIEFAGRAMQGKCDIINGFMEVHGVGGAIMLIRRDCIDAILAKFPEISDTVTVANHASKDLFAKYDAKRLIRAFDHVTMNGEKFSEDLSLCWRWHQAAPEKWRLARDPTQAQVWANITYPITHVGPHEFVGAYIDQIRDQINIEPIPDPAAEQPIATEVAALAMQEAAE